MSRKLATIQQIEKITPIPNADRLELLHVKGWQVISQKGLHKENDFVVFFEIDSFFKEGVEPFHSDLVARGSRQCQLDTGEVINGYLIKTIKLRGELSQGYVVPFNSFSKDQIQYFNKHLVKDYDLTKYLDVALFEKPETGAEREERSRLSRPPKGNWNKIKWLVRTWLQATFPKVFKKKRVRSTFPSFIRKTDCTRIQNIKEVMWDHYNNGTQFQITCKLDGSSISTYRKGKKEGVCSRNLDANMANITNSFVINGTVIHNKLKNHIGDYCVQGEMVAPNIQGNFEGVNKPEVYIYSIWDMNSQSYLNPENTLRFCNKYGLNHVPVLHEKIKLKDVVPDATDAEDLLRQLLLYADGPSGLKGKFREGLVLKQCDGLVSPIKIISNKYLLKVQDNA